MTWSFSDLILLMGTNPLPNYVVAKYFISENTSLRRIWIIHSAQNPRINQAGTKELAENLKRIIGREQKDFYRNDRIKLIPLSDISSAKQIMKDIGEKLTDMMRREDGFSGCHLNYTGGTKTMAVHAYRKLEQVLGDKCTFSYLSGRDFRLKDDQDGDVTGDLKKEINIGLDTLMELHGYEKDKEQDNPNWPEVLDEFKKIIAQNKLKEYLEWVKKHKLDELQDTFRKETPEFIVKLLKKMPEKHSPLDGEKLWISDPKLSNKDFTNRLNKSVKDFLHGKWLDAYVYKIVADNVERLKQEEKRDVPVAGNWKIKKTDPESEKNFELDVIVLNGYQVTGISVTTSGNEKVCKEKGFEVLHRVNQIGGEEGKTILVTCLDKIQRDQVAKDLRLISGSAEDKLEVLGMEDLPAEKLWKKVCRYIWGEVRE